jgi:Cu+-exporting ATPase
MPSVKEAPASSQAAKACYHCGTPCQTTNIRTDDKLFCCEGCQLVYEILNNNGLCDYYKLQRHPGLSQIKAARSDKYAYLDDEAIARPLYRFSDGQRAIVTLYIPGVHCTSCMWLLEHMHRLNPGITESRLNFSTKEVTIHFNTGAISLRQVVELLITIGYEPYISLDDAGNKKKAAPVNKRRMYQLGVAGFCFGNIMLLSFPEYLGLESDMEAAYARLFRILNLVLALPVFFYSASEFFINAWKGFKQSMLNIDAPIALAILITFGRSVFEIVTDTGAGFLDSMSGIVFFMLVGRVVQERTYRSISFHRDYKSYFPIAVNVLSREGEQSRNLHDLKEGDLVRLYHDEIIPADSEVLQGDARIDYSFVTGESEPVHIPAGGQVYAGGKQVGSQLTIRIIKPVASSYLTSLWNHYAFTNNKIAQNQDKSVVHLLSKYFTWVLLSLALITAVYWYITDPAKIAPSVTAMLIVACPCALLLSATFTNGNLLRIFSNNGLFLRDASVIEQLGNINHVVFDKTGTLTESSGRMNVLTEGSFSEPELDMIYSMVSVSKHPNSVALSRHLEGRCKLAVTGWNEVAGQGLEGFMDGHHIRIGSAGFTGIVAGGPKASVYVRIDDKTGSYRFTPRFREGIARIIPELHKRYRLSLLSGDHDHQRADLAPLLGPDNALHFEQKPLDKLQYIENLQKNGQKVLMVGDGLNDAGALQQSNVGITLADDINNFTPSCDAILDAGRFGQMPQLLRLARTGKQIIWFSFFISILYNIIGLYFSVQGLMSPMIAAILMPSSTLSIVLISSGVSSLIARRMGLSLSSRP